MTASDSASWDGSPFDAESSEETPPVVVVVDEAVGVAADLLGEHVDVLDASVRRLAGVVVGENLVAPSVDRACQPRQLGNVGIGAVLEEPDEPSV